MWNFSEADYIGGADDKKKDWKFGVLSKKPMNHKLLYVLCLLGAISACSANTFLNEGRDKWTPS